MDAVAEVNRLSGEALALCFRAAPGYYARLRRNSALVLSGEPFADLNYLFIGPEADAEEVLCEDFAVARERSLPIVALLTPHVAQMLAEPARRLGLTEAEGFPIMVLERPDPLPLLPGFHTQLILDTALLRIACGFVAGAYALPPESYARLFGPAILEGPGVEVYLTFAGSDPISTVQTVRSGSTVGIWTMATPPEHQRKGGGRALLSHVINHFVAQGVSRFYLGASAAGVRLYESVGFQRIASWSAWTSGESTQTG